MLLHIVKPACNFFSVAKFVKTFNCPFVLETDNFSQSKMVSMDLEHMCFSMEGESKGESKALSPYFYNAVEDLFSVCRGGAV